MALYTLPNDKAKSKESVQVGVADGKWIKAGGWNADSGKQTGIRLNPKFVPPVSPTGKPILGKKITAIEILSDSSFGGKDWRIVGFDRSGKEILAGVVSKPMGKKMLSTLYLSSSKSKIGRVELQIRPIVWTDMGNVPLEPKGSEG